LNNAPQQFAIHWLVQERAAGFAVLQGVFDRHC
jgi:hypothetical protein